MAVYDVDQPLQRLLQIKPGPHWIVSCYLKVEPRDRSGGKYLIKLKNRVREVTQSLPALGLSRKEIETVEADLTRVQAALRVDGLPKANGVAVFAGKRLDLFVVIPLPRVHRSRLLVDHTPLVRELVALEDEVGRLLTVVLDRTCARIFEVTAFTAQELADLTAPATRGGRFHSNRHAAPGLGEHGYHNRIRNERQRHLAAVAQRLFELDRERPFRGIVLAGTGGDAESLRPFLHPYLAKKVLGAARLNPKTAREVEVLQSTLEVREHYERRLERHVVAEMLLARGSGWSVNGIAPTLQALAEGQVRTLVVRGDASVPGFRCGSNGRLALTPRECRGDEAVPVPDLVDDAIEEALRQGVAIEVVFEPDAADTIDGLAALLRFK